MEIRHFEFKSKTTVGPDHQRAVPIPWQSLQWRSLAQSVNRVTTRLWWWSSLWPTGGAKPSDPRRSLSCWRWARGSPGHGWKDRRLKGVWKAGHLISEVDGAFSSLAFAASRQYSVQTRSGVKNTQSLFPTKEKSGRRRRNSKTSFVFPKAFKFQSQQWVREGGAKNRREGHSDL